MPADEHATDHLHELATHGTTMLPGQAPGTALRISAESCHRGGCVHLEQMAHSRTLGWYRQKSFAIPRSELAALARLLRMADCLLPATPGADEETQPEAAPAGDAPPLKFPSDLAHEDHASGHRKRSG